MVLDGVVNPGAGAAPGSLQQLLKIGHLMVDPGMAARVDPVQSPEQFQPALTQVFRVAG